MRKIFLLTVIILLGFTPVFAINFGTYKTETEYGLIDGFKWNFFGRKEGEPLVQLKSETEEEKIRIEQNKNKPKEEQDEIQMFRFMTEDVVAF